MMPILFPAPALLIQLSAWDVGPVPAKRPRTIGVARHAPRSVRFHLLRPLMVQVTASLLFLPNSAEQPDRAEHISGRSMRQASRGGPLEGRQGDGFAPPPSTDHD